MKNSEKKELKQLYVCLIEGKDKPFYASLASLQGLVAELRTSTPMTKGATVYLAPVPKDWDGTEIGVDELLKHPNLKMGQVSRTEGRGMVTLRLVTEEAKHFRDQIRAGNVGQDDLAVKASEAGSITTLHVTGGLGVASASILESALQKLRSSSALVLLDMTEMTVNSEASVSFLLRFIKDFERGGSAVAILLKPTCRLLEILADSHSGQMVPVHTSRDMAVASLLERMLEA